ncbi:site-specific integrase [Burkholderia sp. LMG 13014]|uniref:site-specific integrase n=1 Tax=Burkholderia sp. LMG 13014 TaxID=2709306 RepID=UPI001964CC83|nr:site-specific integrase [Burkholderia sp. LMG 13014]
MANKPQTIAHQRSYTRTDFTALRAFVQRVPATAIARLYFTEDENGDEPTPGWVESYLRRMQADLVALAIEHGSPVLADHLKASTRQHGSARLTAISLKMVEQAATLAAASPAPAHSIGMWFRPIVAANLKRVEIHTLGELLAFCNRRGGSWWRAVPRIGAGRARRIVSWLRQHEATLGAGVAADVVLDDPLRAARGPIVLVNAGGALAPLERMAVADTLSGADGLNRASSFPFIAARHDLDAVWAYLHQFREQPKTFRAYRKELERFLLWAIRVRRKPLSSLLVDDCEAYKDFLMVPSPDFVGPKVPRSSSRWRPFASEELLAETRRYSVRALRAAFSWLVDMRYLGGNPWKGVKDPVVVKRETEIRIERALPADLWAAVLEYIARASVTPEGVFWRTLAVLMLLTGDSGLRREEAATARRERLVPSAAAADDVTMWELTVIGKRLKERTVPVSPETINALRMHWRDRGLDFDAPQAAGPLLGPATIPRTPQALRKHGVADGAEVRPDENAPYSVDVLNQLVERARKRLAAGMKELTPDAAARLSRITPHAFRHTFATLWAEDGPLDVLQKLLGHASLDTTTIYVNPEKKRMMAEAGRFYAQRRGKADDA